MVGNPKTTPVKRKASISLRGKQNHQVAKQPFNRKEAGLVDQEEKNSETPRHNERNLSNAKYLNTQSGEYDPFVFNRKLFLHGLYTCGLHHTLRICVASDEENNIKPLHTGKSGSSGGLNCNNIVGVFKPTVDKYINPMPLYFYEISPYTEMKHRQAEAWHVDGITCPLGMDGKEKTNILGDPGYISEKACAGGQTRQKMNNNDEMLNEFNDIRDVEKTLNSNVENKNTSDNNMQKLSLGKNLNHESPPLNYAQLLENAPLQRFCGTIIIFHTSTTTQVCSVDFSLQVSPYNINPSSHWCRITGIHIFNNSMRDDIQETLVRFLFWLLTIQLETCIHVFINNYLCGLQRRQKLYLCQHALAMKRSEARRNVGTGRIDGNYDSSLACTSTTIYSPSNKGNGGHGNNQDTSGNLASKNTGGNSVCKCGKHEMEVNSYERRIDRFSALYHFERPVDIMNCVESIKSRRISDNSMGRQSTNRKSITLDSQKNNNLENGRLTLAGNTHFVPLDNNLNECNIRGIYLHTSDIAYMPSRVVEVCLSDEFLDFSTHYRKIYGKHNASYLRHPHSFYGGQDCACEAFKSRPYYVQLQAALLQQLRAATIPTYIDSQIVSELQLSHTYNSNSDRMMNRPIKKKRRN